MKALETLTLLYSTFEKAGEDLNKEDELFNKDFQEMQKASLKVKEASDLRKSHRSRSTIGVYR